MSRARLLVGEDNKSGLPPLTSADHFETSGLVQLALHIIKECPRLHLQGLMTIGSLAESTSGTDGNSDFQTLAQTRDLLQQAVSRQVQPDNGNWGVNGKLLLSMGMSSDFEAALKEGSDIVRVGTSIFGSRPKKGQSNVVGGVADGMSH